MGAVKERTILDGYQYAARYKEVEESEIIELREAGVSIEGITTYVMGWERSRRKEAREKVVSILYKQSFTGTEKLHKKTAL